jgi:hypothetical protein
VIAYLLAIQTARLTISVGHRDEQADLYKPIRTVCRTGDLTQWIQGFGFLGIIRSELSPALKSFGFSLNATK